MLGLVESAGDTGMSTSILLQCKMQKNYLLEDPFTDMQLFNMPGRCYIPVYQLAVVSRTRLLHNTITWSERFLSSRDTLLLLR